MHENIKIIDELIETTRDETIEHNSQVTYLDGGGYSAPDFVSPIDGMVFSYQLPPTGMGVNQDTGTVPVVGNGKGIGLTDNGIKYSTLGQLNSFGFCPFDGFGKNVGDTVNYSYSLLNSVYGIPTKEQLESNGGLQNSGLEAIVGTGVYRSGIIKKGYKLRLRAGLKYKITINKLEEIIYVVKTERFENGGWCRIWSDGWCEQGGNRAPIQTDHSLTVQLMRPFITTDYFVRDQSIYSTYTGYTHSSPVISIRNLDSFVLIQDTYMDNGGMWEAKGYIS